MTRYVHPWPTGLRVTEGSWREERRIASVSSIFTGRVYQTEIDRPRIVAQVSGLAPPNAWAALDVFEAALRGGHNLAWLTDWEVTKRGGPSAAALLAAVYFESDGVQFHWITGSGRSVWVDSSIGVAPAFDTVALTAAAAAGDDEIDVDGLTPSALGYAAGVEIAIAGRGYRVREDVTADGSGAATLRLAPRLARALPAGAAVLRHRAGLFVLTSPVQGMERDLNGVRRWSMEFREVFREELQGESLVHEKP